MQAVLTTYLVVSPLPIVVDDDGEALSYAPGQVFRALSSNPSVTFLLENDQVVETFGAPSTGTTVIEGPQGPAGTSAATGWEQADANLVRLINDTNQVSAGLPVPSAGVKFTIDASAGAYPTGLLVVNGVISSPGAGALSERFGVGSLAGGACALALGNGAGASGTSSSAGGCGAAATAAFGTVWGAFGIAGLDSTSLGAGSISSQSGTAVGRVSVSTGLRSFSGGIGATNVGADSALVGANGNIAADQTAGIGANISITGAGGIGAGFGASIGGIDASAWGRAASAPFLNSHAFGPGAATTAPNQAVFGSQASPIEFYYFGRGEAAVTKQDVRLASTRIGTTQVDGPGSNLILEAGPGTGNAAPSKIYLQTAPAVGTGNAQQPLATQMLVGDGVDIGPITVASTAGDLAAGDGLALLHWDVATPQLNLGVEGAITIIRGFDSISAGVDGGGLYLVGGTGLTTGNGPETRVAGGDSGSAGTGGRGLLIGGLGIVAGGPAEVLGGTSVGAPGGSTTLRGGPGAPAGALIASGGITNGVGGQSGAGTFTGGDASATLISMAGDGILKGGDGVSNNNHGAHAYIRGGLAFGGGVHGRVQIDTAGVGRWQVDNAGQLLAVTDNTYDIGASAAGRPRDLFVARNAVIDGNLTINGTTTTIDSQVQTADNYILLNSEYTADAPQTAGLVLNIDPASTSFSISDITTNVVTVVSGDPSAVLSAGDFVLIQNPANASNAGLREVLSTTITSITIDPTPVEAFTGAGLTDDATVQGVIVGVSIAVIRSDTAGAFEQAFGATAPLSYSALGGGGGGGGENLAATLAIGSSTGANNIVVNSGQQIGGGRANFGTATDASADGDLAAGLVGVSRLAYSQATGGLATFFTNGESSGLRYASAVVDFSASGTATGLIPAGALPVGVTTRVLTVISGGGATGYNVGDVSDNDRWGSIAALTAGTVSDPTDYTDNTLSFNNSASAVDVVLSGIGGAPTAGTVRVTLAYLSFTAPTS